jgi:formiminoglutamase
MADAMQEALAIAGAAGGPVHVDLDVDVCDRSVAPACPASAPGGISADDLREASFLAARSSLVRSIDIAEIDATADTPDGRTVRLGALLLLEAAAGLAVRGR